MAASDRLPNSLVVALLVEDGDSQQNLFFVLKVSVDGAPRDAGSFGDTAYAESGDTGIPDGLERSVKDPPPGCVLLI